MALKPLIPPCKVPLGESWSLVAVEAGRTADGVETTLALFEGEAMRDTDNKKVLANPPTRRGLTKRYAPKAGVSAKIIDDALLELSRAVEGQLRQMDAEAKAAQAQAKAEKTAAAQAQARHQFQEPPADDDPATSLGTVGPCTQGANAQRIRRDFEGKLLYTTGAGWLMWTGSHWRIDPSKDDALTTGFVATLPQAIAQEAQSLMQHALQTPPGAAQKELLALANERVKWALQSDNASAIGGALKMAKHGLRRAFHEFDAHPWLFNCTNGTLDLQTLTIRNHDPNDLLTRCAPVVFNEQATCPRWESFLLEVFAGNDEMVRFMQRIIGWSLTGIVRERALFFLYGPTGTNGKTTIVETIRELLGSCGEEDDEVGYARKVDVNTFMVGKNVEENQRKMAALVGPRFVYTSEVDTAHRLNERLIKDITGGDTVDARRLYHEPFSFKPTFKPWMYGNYRPTIGDTDDAIWDRVNLIEFNVCFRDKIDLTLGETLKAELSGILNWALAGVRMWQKEGINTPSAVRAATQAYRVEQDIFTPFITERCEVGPDKRGKFAALWNAYKRWCARNEEEEAKQGRFTNYLNAKGYLSDNNASGHGAKRLGIALKTAPDPDEDDDPNDLFSQAKPAAHATPGATPAARGVASRNASNDAGKPSSSSSFATPDTLKKEKSRGEADSRRFTENGVAGVAAPPHDEPLTRIESSDEPCYPPCERGSTGVASCRYCGDTQIAIPESLADGSTLWHCATCRKLRGITTQRNDAL